MANALVEGASKALGLPMAGAIVAALAGQLYLWSFGPYGLTQERPVCHQGSACVVVAGLDGDVSYGFGAGGQVFGVDFNDDVTERLVTRLSTATPREGEARTSILKYTEQVKLPEAGDAREQDDFFGSLAEARRIGTDSRATLVVMGRVVGDDVLLWFVDPNSDQPPRPADYSMTAPDAQQTLAHNFTEALAEARAAQLRREAADAIVAAAAAAGAAAPSAPRPAAVRPAPPPVAAPTQTAAVAAAPPPPQQAQTRAPVPQPTPQVVASNAPPPVATPQQRTLPPASVAPAPVQRAPTPQPASAAVPPPPARTATPAVAIPDGPMVYQCADQRVLRVVFDAGDRSASVRQYGRPPITLRLASSDGPFRFARSGYELAGSASEVTWRIGSGDPVRCTRHSY